MSPPCAPVPAPSSAPSVRSSSCSLAWPDTARPRPVFAPEHGLPLPEPSPLARSLPFLHPSSTTPIVASSSRDARNSPLLAPIPSPAPQLRAFHLLPFADDDDGYFPHHPQVYEPQLATSTPEWPGGCTPPLNVSAATTPESPGPPRTPPSMQCPRPRTPRPQWWTVRPGPDEYPPPPRLTPPPPASPADHRCGCSFDFATGGMSVSRAELAFFLVAWSVQNPR